MTKRKFLLITLSVLLVLAAVIAPTFGGMTAYAYSDSVYLGGTPVGIVIGIDGVLVQELSDVIGKNGAVKPAENAGIRVGDYIYMINDKRIEKVSDIANALSGVSGEINVLIKRGNDSITVKITPEYDVIANAPKLGLKVKDELAGVGTLTFVTADGKQFGALGHQIFDPKTDVREGFGNGNVYACSILGVVKGEEGKPGELRGTFDRTSAVTGHIQKNNFTGVFGTSEAILYDGRPLVARGGRDSVKPGKAYVYTTIYGNTPDKYEIEIVKAEKQNSPQDRSMVIHVTDERLLNTTGGIVQGMSGSPIVQNGKLIGAVTHVFINDPTRGYAIYLDWMEEKGIA